MMRLSAEELALLSPEEQEALADDGTDSTLLDAVLDDANVLGDDELDETNSSTDAAQVDADDVDAASTDTNADDVDEVDTGFVAVREHAPVEGYTEKVAAINAERDALVVKLEEGEIDMKEFVTQDRLLSSQETDLRLAQHDAIQAAKENRSTEEQRWKWQQENFFEQTANKIYEKPLLYAAFNASVIEIANLPENAGKSGAWVLKQADKAVRAEFGQTTPARVVDERKPDLKNLPKSLANLPSADLDDTSIAGEFSYIDRLEVGSFAHEQALAALAKDPVKEARYLRSSV